MSKVIFIFTAFEEISDIDMNLCYFTRAVINADARAEKLESLITEADRKVNDFTASIVNCTADIKV